jgi:hypothetical protein
MDKGRAERPRFPFGGKPSLNVHLEDPNNLLDYFELFITPEIADLIRREKPVCPTLFRKYTKVENKT